MAGPLISYLLIVTLSAYLIIRFFARKMVLNLIAGVGFILMPALIVITRIFTGMGGSPSGLGTIVALGMAGVFAVLTYFASLAATAARSQWQRGEWRTFRPSAIDIIAYAVGMVLIVAFAASYIS